MYQMPLPSQKTLLKLLDYNTVTGDLTWKPRANETTGWNSRYAGKLAGATDNKGYIQIGVFNRLFKGHRIIWKMVNGNDPNTIDHIDGNPANNRLANLRAVTHAENHKNRKLSKLNKSGMSGVRWYDRSKKWVAVITLNGKRHHVGYFAKKSDAIKAAGDAYKAAGFHENHGRHDPGA